MMRRAKIFPQPYIPKGGGRGPGKFFLNPKSRQKSPKMGKKRHKMAKNGPPDHFLLAPPCSPWREPRHPSASVREPPWWECMTTIPFYNQDRPNVRFGVRFCRTFGHFLMFGFGSVFGLQWPNVWPQYEMQILFCYIGT